MVRNPRSSNRRPSCPARRASFSASRNGLFPVVQFPIASEQPADLGLRATELGDPSGLAFLFRQLG